MAQNLTAENINEFDEFPAIDEFHVTENIWIIFLIALMSRLDALDARKNVL